MFAGVRVAIGHGLPASSLAILAMVFPPAHASAATSATPAAATASVVLKPLIVVRQIEVLFVDGSSGADLYGTVKVTDVDGSASSVAFDRGEYDSVPVQSWSDAPVSPNGLSAAKLSISVDLWDHWSPVFIPDRPVAQGTIDTRSGHSGLNAVVVRGRGKSAVEITYSKQTSWQKSTIDKVVLKDSDDNPAQIFGWISASVVYTDQAAKRSTVKVPFFDRNAIDYENVRHGEAIWDSSPPLTLYTDMDSVTLTADIWDYNRIFRNEHIANGSLTIPPTYSAKSERFSRDITGPDGAVTVSYTTVRETESPVAAGLTTFKATSSETGAYWTPAKMKDATADAEPASFADVSGARLHRRGDIVPAQNRTVGKVFFRRAGHDLFCSGVSVPSGEGNQVETAAHCLLSFDTLQATDVVFVPGSNALDTDPAPWGVWRYVTVSLLNGWALHRDLRFDQAVIRVAPDTQGRTLRSRVGFSRIVFDQSPDQPFATAQGYTLTPGASAGRLYECSGTAEEHNGESRMICNLRGGSSGGPMFTCDPFQPDSSAVYAVISGGVPTIPDVAAFPHSLLLRDLMLLIDSHHAAAD